MVGLIIGFLLVLVHGLLSMLAPQLDPSIMAAVLLCLWVAITGALHLDGLADSADAWLGGGDRDRTLQIMKDPRSGPAGVTSIVLVLLLKFACLQQIVVNGPWLLLLAPALARGLMPVLFLHTPYVRENGLATPFREGLSSTITYRQMGAMVLLWLLLMGFAALPALLLVALAFWGLRQLMLQRLGGTTGDTAGAAVEILEAVSLLAIALAMA